MWKIYCHFFISNMSKSDNVGMSVYVRVPINYIPKVVNIWTRSNYFEEKMRKNL